MKILTHHIYEYKKGLRNLVLHTMPYELKDSAEAVLKRQRIEYVIQVVNERKINIFFGAQECVDIVTGFVHKQLNELSDDEDFMLGIMLGYKRLDQCRRFLKRKLNRKKIRQKEAG